MDIAAQQVQGKVQHIAHEGDQNEGDHAAGDAAQGVEHLRDDRAILSSVGTPYQSR